MTISVISELLLPIGPCNYNNRWLFIILLNCFNTAMGMMQSPVGPLIGGGGGGGGYGAAGLGLGAVHQQQASPLAGGMNVDNGGGMMPNFGIGQQQQQQPMPPPPPMQPQHLNFGQQQLQPPLIPLQQLQHLNLQQPQQAPQMNFQNQFVNPQPNVQNNWDQLRQQISLLRRQQEQQQQQQHFQQQQPQHFNMPQQQQQIPAPQFNPQQMNQGPPQENLQFMHHQQQDMMNRSPPNNNNPFECISYNPKHPVKAMLNDMKVTEYLTNFLPDWLQDAIENGKKLVENALYHENERSAVIFQRTSGVIDEYVKLAAEAKMDSLKWMSFLKVSSDLLSIEYQQALNVVEVAIAYRHILQDVLNPVKDEYTKQFNETNKLLEGKNQAERMAKAAINHPNNYQFNEEYKKLNYLYEYALKKQKQLENLIIFIKNERFVEDAKQNKFSLLNLYREFVDKRQGIYAQLFKLSMPGKYENIKEEAIRMINERYAYISHNVNVFKPAGPPQGIPLAHQGITRNF